MAWFSPFTRDLVNLTPDDLQADVPPSGSLLDRGRASVGDMLGKLRASEGNLVDEIADKTERLRETRIAIEAFEAASKIMTNGDPDFSEIDEVTGPAAVDQRLVPRSPKTIRHIHRDIRS